MVTYILLMKLTDKGALDIAALARACRRRHEALGVDGRQDARDLPDYGRVRLRRLRRGTQDRTAAAFSLALGSTGTVRTTSLKAYSLDEAKQIVAALPKAIRPRDLTNHFAADAPRRSPLCPLARMR